MRVRRLLAAIVTTGLIAPTAVVVASSTAPASAAAPTQIVSGYQNQPFVYASRKPTAAGETINARALVLDAAGQSVSEGTVYLQRQLAGEADFTNIASGTYGSVYNIGKAVRNASYRIYFSGSANYNPALSAPIKIDVGRKLTTKSIRGKQAGLKGRIKPGAKVKIVIQKKVGKKYKKYKTSRTTRKGTYKIILPAPRTGRTYWKITFAGSKGYSKTVWKGYTYKSF